MVAPIVLTYVLILANRHTVHGDTANGRTFRIAATAAMSLLLVGQTLLRFFGVGQRLPAQTGPRRPTDIPRGRCPVR